MSSKKKYLRRISFKLSIKDKWLSTYWYYCDNDDLPYSLKDFFDHLVKMFDENELYIKIERKVNTKQS